MRIEIVAKRVHRDPGRHDLGTEAQIVFFRARQRDQLEDTLAARESSCRQLEADTLSRGEADDVFNEQDARACRIVGIGVVV